MPERMGNLQESETGKAFRRARSIAGRLRMLSISPCRTSMPMILNALSKPDSDPDSLLFGIGVVLCCISVGVLVKDIALSSWRTLLCLPGGHRHVFLEDIAPIQFFAFWRGHGQFQLIIVRQCLTIIPASGRSAAAI